MNTGNEEVLKKIDDLSEKINKTLNGYYREWRQANANRDKLVNEIKRREDITKSDEDSEKLQELKAEVDMIDKEITDLDKVGQVLMDRLKDLRELDIRRDDVYNIIDDFNNRTYAESDLLDIKKFVIRQDKSYKQKYISAIKKKEKLEKRLSHAKEGSASYAKILDNLNEANKDVETATENLEVGKSDITRYEALLADYNDSGIINESTDKIYFDEIVGMKNELVIKIKREEMAEKPEEVFRIDPATGESWPLSKFITEYGTKEGYDMWEMLDDEGSSSSFKQLPRNQPSSSQMHAAEQLPRNQPGSSQMHAAAAAEQLPASASKPRGRVTKKIMNTSQMPTASLQQIPEEEYRYSDIGQLATMADFQAHYQDNWRYYWDSAERMQQAPPPHTDVGTLSTAEQIRRDAARKTLSKIRKNREESQGGGKQRHIAKTKKTMRLEYLLNLGNKLLKHKFKKQRNIKNIRKTKKYKNNKK